MPCIQIPGQTPVSVEALFCPLRNERHSAKAMRRLSSWSTWSVREEDGPCGVTPLRCYGGRPGEQRERGWGIALGGCSTWALRVSRRFSGERDKWKVPWKGNSSEIHVRIVRVP